MNLFILYNDDVLIILTDSYNTIKRIRKIINKPIFFILINNKTNISSKYIYKLNYTLNIKFPLFPKTGNNNLINNYYKYRTEFTGYYNFINLFDDIKLIFQKILNNYNYSFDIYNYLIDILPKHILYKYSNISLNIFNKYQELSWHYNEYLFINDLFILDGLIYKKNYEYDDYLAFEKNYWLNILNDEYKNEEYFYKYSKPININVINDDYIYIILTQPWGWHNFGEFLDSVQKLYIIDKYNFDKTLFKIVLNIDNKIIDFCKYFINLGYTYNQLFFIEKNHTYTFKKCLFISLQTYPARLTPITKTWFVSKQFINIPRTINTNINLFLDRNKLCNRIIIDIDYQFLLKNNFIIIYGSENLEYIIEIFRNANIIIGSHGSLFRNLIYCYNDPLIMEFCPKNRKNYAQFELAQLSNMKYSHILCDADNDYNIHWNTIIDYIQNIIK